MLSQELHRTSTLRKARLRLRPEVELRGADKTLAAMTRPGGRKPRCRLDLRGGR